MNQHLGGTAIAALAVAGIVALMFAAGVAAQEPTPAAPAAPTPTPSVAPVPPAEPAAPQAEFADIIHVKVVNVIAYVRDKDGNPVTGLTKDDFELLEDKAPVAITNFYEVNAGRRTDEVIENTPEAQLERLRSNPELDPRESRVPEDQRLWLVVYVDHFNIRPFNRNRVFRFLRDFLRTHLDREDRVALVSYTRSVKVERGFTRDSQLIATALDDLEKHTGNRTQMDSERLDLLRDIKDARDPGIVQGRVRLFAENQFNDLQFTVDGIKEMLGSLAGVPGRKAVLYVSDGLPMRAGEDMFVAASEIDPDNFSGMRMDALHYDASRMFTEIANSANANGVAFYTLDATGLGGRDSRGAEVGEAVYSSNIDGVLQDNMQSSIMFLADKTGGQFIVNTNNFSAGFDRFGTDFNDYYSLGFSPAHAGSGRLYDIQVRVKGRKDLKVRHRANYRDKSIEIEMEESTLAALQFGVQKNDHNLSLHQGEQIAGDDGTYTVHIDLRIPIGELVLLPREGGFEGRLRIWIQARDEKGDLSAPQVEPLPIWVPTADIERALGMYFTRTLPLRMRAGDQRVTVALRDDYGARTSLVSTTLRVGGGG